jgi:hypothetical protein
MRIFTQPIRAIPSLWGSVLLIVVFPAPARAQGDARGGELEYGRRVQVMSPTLGSGWHEGVPPRDSSPVPRGDTRPEVWAGVAVSRIRARYAKCI